MNDSKPEGKLSQKKKVYVLACLAIGLLGVALFRMQFPELRDVLNKTLLIATLLVVAIAVFRKRK
ncbi:MAG: hypothetical protein ABI374_08155 [Ginsengibacter sp.]